MNLLIVDDEIVAIRGLLEDIDRENLPFEEVLIANSYAQAVNIFMKQHIDILLCDIGMPYGTGIDLVEWIKERNYDTECIFLTCHDEFTYARQAVKLQCFDYVLKPASPEVINQVLRKAVEMIGRKRKEQIYKDYGKMYIDSMGTQEKDRDVRDTKHAVEEVEEYIRQHIDENLYVEELAQMVYLSSAHLSRSFKKKHGITLMDYITNERMKLARELLEQGELSITMISAKVGYSNYSYFTKLFRKLFGMTPREYRQEKNSRKIQ